MSGSSNDTPKPIMSRSSVLMKSSSTLGRADGAGLLEQPLKGGRRDEGIAEDGAGEEQHGGDQHRGDNPAALIGAQGRQEERKNLPDDHGRAHGERDLDGDVELDGEAAERGHDRKLLARAAGNR